MLFETRRLEKHLFHRIHQISNLARPRCLGVQIYNAFNGNSRQRPVFWAAVHERCRQRLKGMEVHRVSDVTVRQVTNPSSEMHALLPSLVPLSPVFFPYFTCLRIGVYVFCPICQPSLKFIGGDTIAGAFRSQASGGH
ncbi:hypothetical protein RRG08_007627 [Elysia crispata]|uniref:Uncharacterized protein n=1 Tax=Elysia crispata TaxID=231223 RepID=A0AAE1BC26_9GAST|nr:hypothetical protein RRG08_007627 [Elysia crispata]